MYLIDFSRSDISLSLAIRSYEMTSFSPEKRGESVVNDYVAHMQAVNDEFEAYATDDNRAGIQVELERYRQGYVSRLRAYLQAHSRVVSQMITGAGGWTSAHVRRNQKANDSTDKRNRELLDYSSKVLDKLRSQFDPSRIDRRPINSGDDDALERLEDRLARLEALQERMKAANKIVRSRKQDGAHAKLAELGYTEEEIHNLYFPRWGKPGHKRHELTNNGAAIRTVKARIEDQKRKAQETDKEYTGMVNGIEVEIIEDTADDRLRIVFPGKPDASTRDLLKRHGFKWSPMNSAWQRQLTGNARFAVKHYVLDRA